MKEHEKLGQKQVSKVTLHFVWGHISRKQTVNPTNQFTDWVYVAAYGLKITSKLGYFKLPNSFMKL